MKKFQLKKLIEECIREMEEYDPETDTMSYSPRDRTEPSKNNLSYKDDINNKIKEISLGKDNVNTIIFSRMESHQPQINFISGDVWPLDWKEFIYFIEEYGKLKGKI